jgi:hypothetical protein
MSTELEKLKAEKEKLESELAEKKHQEFLDKEAKRREWLFKLQSGDPETVNQFMIQRTRETQADKINEMRQRAQYAQRKEQELAEEQEAKFQKKLSKLTSEQKQARETEKEQLEMQQQEEVNTLQKDLTDNLDIIESFFSAENDNFLKYYNELERHTVDESPVRKLIKGEQMNYQCVLDENERVYDWDPLTKLPSEHTYYHTYANTVNTIEWHVYHHRPQVHKDYLINLENTEFAKHMHELKEKHSKELQDQYRNI